MRDAFRAELVKLNRPRMLYGAGAVLPLLALLATVLSFVTADKTASADTKGSALASTFAQLAAAGGMSRGFQIAAGFIDILVLGLFAANVANEYTQGTLRTLLTRQPRRGRLLAGKLAALISATAAVLFISLFATIAAGFLVAHLRGISTGQWFTTQGLEQGARNYGNALLGITLFALLGASIAAIARSTIVAVGIGIAWMGPLEHIIQAAWNPAGRWLPGLLIDAIIRNGDTTVTYQRALLEAIVYTCLFTAAGATSFFRRDVP